MKTATTTHFVLSVVTLLWMKLRLILCAHILGHIGRCMHTHMYTHTHTCIHTCTRTHMHTHMYSHTHTRIHYSGNYADNGGKGIECSVCVSMEAELGTR